MRRLLFVVLLLLPALALAQGQKKKPPAKADPAILLALPLGLPAGKATKVTLRGLKLDQAKEVRIQGVKATVKFLKKGPAAVPAGLDANKVGNTQGVQ